MISVLEPGGGIQILPPLSCHHVTSPLPPMSPLSLPCLIIFLPPLSCHRVTSLLPDKTLSKCRISCAPPLKTECFHSICRLCTAVNFCLLPRTTNSAFPATCQTEMFPSDGCTTVISHPWQHFPPCNISQATLAVFYPKIANFRLNFQKQAFI